MQNAWVYSARRRNAGVSQRTESETVFESRTFTTELRSQHYTC